MTRSLRTGSLILAVVTAPIILLQGCSYRWMRVTDTEGKGHWTRFYKDREKRQAYHAKSIFKHPGPQGAFSPYPPTGKDTSQGFTYFSFDTTRVYIPDSLKSWFGAFESGAISNRSFYCKEDSCRLPDKSLGWTLATGEPLVPDFLGWKGHAIIVHEIRTLAITGKYGSRRQLLIFASRPMQYGYTVYVAELVNESANRRTLDLDFYRSARLAFFEYAWTEI